MKKKLISLGLILMITCVLYFIFMTRGHHGQKVDLLQEKENKMTHKENNQEKYYSANTLIKAFENNDIVLTQVNQNTTKYKKANVTPTEYLVNQDEDDRLYLYVFDSTPKRMTVSDNEELSYLPASNTKETIVQEKEAAWNLYIVRRIKFNKLNRLPNIHNIIFKELNDGKVKVFSGSSKHWKGEDTLHYYVHQWSENGHLYNESVQSNKGVLTFTGKRKDKVKYNLNVREGNTRTKSNGTLDLSKEQSLQIGSGGNSPIISDEIHVSIQWGKQKEQFNLISP
ncbi:hypothetical protein JOD43_002518 [Pullulanibacillus pueri]|uniref:Uncharacterized protein n=1 Tax=Pullulanibacillus pueri TaxID=1437324 RepID=A0A8J2ZW42_9BACL|nr:hypothetical protein [Pullulanibacillus pueri]MBM7682343.1 hypothetical protein [Pullulanibacillus pueri]GGH80726.1 hypothetical protein GCM10007096_17560 [Pullulanibacillus pueri]